MQGKDYEYFAAEAKRDGKDAYILWMHNLIHTTPPSAQGYARQLVKRICEVFPQDLVYYIINILQASAGKAVTLHHLHEMLKARSWHGVEINDKTTVKFYVQLRHAFAPLLVYDVSNEHWVFSHSLFSNINFKEGCHEQSRLQ